MADLTLEPLTWRIQEEIRAALKRITVANGYRTDLGESPIQLEIEQRANDAADKALVMITAGDSLIDDDKSTASVTYSTTEYLIEACVPYDDGNGQRLAHRVRSDLLRALIPLRKNRKLRDPGVSAFRITGSSISPPNDAGTNVIVEVTAQVDLLEDVTPELS